MKYFLFVVFLMVAIIIDSNAQTCSAKTQAGTACSRKVEKVGVKCWQHGGQTKAQKSGSTALASTGTSSTCGAATKAGGKCKNRVKSGQKCYLHKS